MAESAHHAQAMERNRVVRPNIGEMVHIPKKANPFDESGDIWSHENCVPPGVSRLKMEQVGDDIS